MLKRKKYLTLGYLIVGSLLSGGTISSAFAVNYTVIAGSPVIVRSVDGPIPGPSHRALVSVTNTQIQPFLGGLAMPNSAEKLGCVTSSMITTADGRKGVIVHNSGIIAGLTGTISGSRVVFKNMNDDNETLTLTGGLVFDANGTASPIGDATAAGADVLCAGGLLPFAKTQIGAAGNDFFSATDEPGTGNKLGEFSGQLWLYVPRTVAPGTYTMDEIGISQGASFSANFSGYLAITQPGDTITVLPPPCTIATDTSITFDTRSAAGRTVSAPISYQCGDVAATTELDAYLLANAVGSTLSTTELKLTSAEGSKPGGVVRGYVGQGVDTGNVNCTDTSNSLSFNGAFNTLLAPVSSGANQQIPLVWQLCLKGDEAPGLATGSVWLDIGYK